MPAGGSLRLQPSFFFLTASLFFPTRQYASLNGDAAVHPRKLRMRYLFEDYALDTDRRELCRRGNVVRLEPQAFDLLEFLVRNRERVVSRDDLIAAIWRGRIVSDSAMTTRINAARLRLVTLARRNASSRLCLAGAFASWVGCARRPAGASGGTICGPRGPT